MTRIEKRKALIFLGVAVLVTALLGSNLSQMELKPGIPPPSFEGGYLVAPQETQSTPIHIHINSFFLILAAICLGAYLLVLVFRLLMGTPWKNLLAESVRFVLILVGAFTILGLVVMLLSNIPLVMDEPLPMPTPPEPPASVPLGSPPVSLIWIVGIGLAVLAAVLIISVLNARRSQDTAAQLVLEAEKARQGILAGLDLKEVILRCYQQMSQVLQQEGGIERREFMTPAEFERQLGKEGFPKPPVHQLTRLFEIVRYGDGTPNPWDNQKALDSLDAIIGHLREEKAQGEDEQE